MIDETYKRYIRIFWLYNFNIAPSKTLTIDMVKGWYPNAKNIKGTERDMYNYRTKGYNCN